LIRVLDAWDKLDRNTWPLWNDLVDAAGLFPYINSSLSKGSSLLRYEFHKSPFLPNIYLHEEQNLISLELQSQKSVVLSAPTSFGKSLLIEELIAGKIYSNIVIIQPTLALLDETRKKLQKYKDSYKIIVSTSQLPSVDFGNIFLFTGERVVEYSHFSEIDFFIIDEFYKLSLNRDDDRAVTLNQAFYKLLKLTDRFYLLGPSVKSIPADFKKKFSFLWFQTSFSTVAVDETLVADESRINTEQKKQLLFRLLSELQSQHSFIAPAPKKLQN
jgi:hypothetical protein